MVKLPHHKKISANPQKRNIENYAKISSPKPEGIIPRERLFRLLDRYLGKGIIFVSGPPGSGKTSLIASYVDIRRIPCLWYQIDQGDTDIGNFFYYMGIAAKKAAPRYKKPLPLFTPEYSLGLNTFTRRYFENLFLRLKSPYLLVFDNYQEIPSDSQFHEIFCLGLSSLLPGISVMIISRIEPPAPYVAMEVKNKIRQIGWNELRLSLEESKKIAQREGIAASDSKMINWLHEKTDGWVAGLVLLVRAVRSEKIDFESLKDFPPREILYYFGSVLFNQLDNAIKNFLIKTAFLPKITPRLAEILTGNKEAGQILSNLVQRNFFVEKYTQPELTYQYHALFKDFLILQAKTYYPSVELSGWQLEAANLLEDSGYMEGAADLFIQARAWKELTALIQKNALMLIRQGRNKMLERWITAMPEEWLKADPWLNYWLAYCRLGVEPTESRLLFEHAFQLFISSGDEAGTLLAWSGAVQTFLYDFDDFRPLDRWISWLDEWRARRGEFPSPDIGLIVSAGMIAALNWRLPNHPEIHKWVKRAIEFSKNSPNVEAGARAYNNSAVYYIWMGMFDECRMLIDEMKKMVASQPVSPLRSLAIKHAEAMLNNASVDFYSEAKEAILAGLEEAQKTGIHIFDPLFLNQGIICSLNEGNSQRAKEFLDKLEKILPARSRVHSGHYFFLLAFYYLVAGKMHQALLAAQKSLDLLQEMGVPVSEILARLVLLYIHLETGEKVPAERELRSIKAVIRKTGSYYFEYLSLLIDAYIQYSKKNEAEGLTSLRKAMNLGRKKEFITLLYFWRPAIMSFLCEKALEVGIEIEYVQNLIRKLNLIPNEKAISSDAWPWPVKIYTLGKFQIFIDGKPIQFSTKLPRMPLLLLKSLIALGGEEVKEEQLVDLLWPEADGDMAHWSLETTLHRLRKWLQHAEALQFRNGIASFNRKVCWIDALVFEQFVEEGDIQEKMGRVDQAAETVEKAISLYKGPFLGGEKEESWSIPVRERLRRKFLRCVSLLGDYWEKTQQWEKAIDVYGRGLEIDNIAEEFYQRLMICYQRLGRTAEAMRTYEQCKKILASVLGIKPSPKTESILKSLQ